MNRKTAVTLTFLCAASASALQVLYTAEGDGSVATDRLTGDGAQNGAFTQTLSDNTKSATADVFVGTPAKFGSSAFGFNLTSSYLNTLDIPNSSTLGSTFTLAAFVRPNSSPFLSRLFSTYSGGGSAANQLLFDYGSEVDGLRLLVNSVAVLPSPAVTLPANAYSHLAATYDNGAVVLYVNGIQVGSGTAGSGTPVINNGDSRSIQVGEDWLWGTMGNAEESVGYMDEILIYDRALSSNEINRLTVASAAEFFCQDGILYTAEGDTTNATDRLTQTLAQDGMFGTTGVTVRADNPKFGTRAFNFVDTDGSGTDVLLLPDSKVLGERFTLAAQVDTASAELQRLFSSYTGSGPVGEDALIFEFDPDGSSGFTMRLNHSDIWTTDNTAFNDGDYHHLAVTYDNGAVRLYLDGAQVGSGTNGEGAVTMANDLRVGEDVGGVVNEQLVGDVDDILFCTNTLSLGAIRQVAYSGAQAYFAGTLSRPGILYSAEGDTSGATDLLTSDGAQNGVFTSAGVTVSAGNPKFGYRAFNFAGAVGNEVRDVIRLSGSKSLGERFTLAAYVDTTAPTSFQRLFSSYTGRGAVTAAQVLFDFDPDGVGTPAMQFYCGGQVTTASVPFNDGAYHHLAATYDNGEVRLYLDGTQVGIGTNGTGAVTMAQDLQIGEDVGTLGDDEQLRGDVDDAVVLFEALSPGDIVTLMTVGAHAFLNLPPLWPKGTRIDLY